MHRIAKPDNECAPDLEAKWLRTRNDVTQDKRLCVVYMCVCSCVCVCPTFSLSHPLTYIKKYPVNPNIQTDQEERKEKCLTTPYIQAKKTRKMIAPKSRPPDPRKQKPHDCIQNGICSILVDSKKPLFLCIQTSLCPRSDADNGTQPKIPHPTQHRSTS